MFRLVCSIILAIAVSGATAASVAHMAGHDTHHAGHANMADSRTLPEAETLLATCCDSTGGTGVASCLGDLVATVRMTVLLPRASTTIFRMQAGTHLAGMTGAIPTGPPKA